MRVTAMPGAVPRAPAANHRRTMDVDALAREVADRFMRWDLAGPPFPPYLAHWGERMRAQAERATGGVPDDPSEGWPKFESFEQVGYERVGDELDVYLYRIEPTATALLLVMRGDSLAYTALAGSRFMMPENEHDRFPPFDLSFMAMNARAEGELDVPMAGWSTQNDAPVYITFEIEPERYAELDDAARDALHHACARIARDAALLFCGRPGALVVGFYAPEPPQTGGVYHVGRQREAIATFDVS
jgi:hypothetical protein